MPFTRDQCLQALASWQPAQVFLDSYRTRQLPENCSIYFGPPEEFFLASDSQRFYGDGRIMPILDDGNFGAVTFHDPDARRLLEIYVETPGEVCAEFNNWQQYLANLLRRIGEAEDDDARMLRMSELLGFRYAEELFDFWHRTNILRSDELNAEWRIFLAGIRV